MSTASTFRYHTELIDGVEREKPLPKKLHAQIQQRLIKLLLEQGVNGVESEILPELNVLCGYTRPTTPVRPLF